MMDSEVKKSVPDKIKDFVVKSERVINVTHKPKPYEFRQIAYVTAIGMTVIGGIGFIISMAAFFLHVA